jgi:hypothetical protein
MKKKIKELALEAGGSTYPEVGGKILERFAELVISECVAAVRSTGKQCAYTTYDLGVVECTINKSVAAINERFQDNDTQ